MLWSSLTVNQTGVCQLLLGDKSQANEVLVHKSCPKTSKIKSLPSMSIRFNREREGILKKTGNKVNIL